MLDPSALLTAASIVGAFGTSVLTFRLQRELQVADSGGPNWIPWADVLILGASVLSLVVVAALLVFDSRRAVVLSFASSGLAGSAILVAGYPLAILAHYRLIFARGRSGPRDNPEPAERVLVVLCALLAVAGAIAAYRNG